MTTFYLTGAHAMTDIEKLRDAVIFKDMDENEIMLALAELEAEEKEFRKSSYVYRAGTATERMGLVLDGSVRIENNDLWGNRTILSHVGAGDFFAETYALLADEPMAVDVVANEKSRILFLRTGILGTLTAPGSSHIYKIIANLLSISAQKNLLLSRRSFHTSPKTVRARVMAYLSSVSLRSDSRYFDIPFDRQQMADYLNLDRTALSKELGRMRDDGIIDFHKNHFILKST